jgi:hypothetical protein
MRKVGITLLSIGIIVYLVYLARNFFFSNDYSLLLKIAVGAAALGVIFLVVSAIVKRVRQMQKENEKKVKRIDV